MTVIVLWPHTEISLFIQFIEFINIHQTKHYTPSLWEPKRASKLRSTLLLTSQQQNQPPGGSSLVAAGLTETFYTSGWTRCHCHTTRRRCWRCQLVVQSQPAVSSSSSSSQGLCSWAGNAQDALGLTLTVTWKASVPKMQLHFHHHHHENRGTCKNLSDAAHLEEYRKSVSETLPLPFHTTGCRDLWGHVTSSL